MVLKSSYLFIRQSPKTNRKFDNFEFGLLREDKGDAILPSLECRKQGLITEAFEPLA
jgi:hypothetical protein